MSDVDIQRRGFLVSAAVGAAALTAFPITAWGATGRRTSETFAEQVAALEQQCNGRLGVAVLNSSSRVAYGYRANERFLMCSTFKVALVACVLQRVDRGQDRLDRALALPSSGILVNSPVTERNAGKSLSLRELCQAAIVVSDNSIANVLLEHIGGPARLTRFLREHGDRVTRLDRFEVELNRPAMDPTWDTTSPSAMADLLRRLLYGKALSSTSAAQVRTWMTQCRTGLNRLRSGLPESWAVGDKTGNSSTMANDVAWSAPPGQSPWLVAAYFEQHGDGDGRDRVHPMLARVVARFIGQHRL